MRDDHQHLAELDECAKQLKLRMAVCATMPAAQCQRAVALFDPVWDLLLVLEHDGGTGELELAFFPLGITSLAAQAAMVGQLGEAAA